jgi:hypothetical protein
MEVESVDVYVKNPSKYIRLWHGEFIWYQINSHRNTVYNAGDEGAERVRDLS